MEVLNVGGPLRNACITTNEVAGSHNDVVSKLDVMRDAEIPGRSSGTGKSDNIMNGGQATSDLNTLMMTAAKAGNTQCMQECLTKNKAKKELADHNVRCGLDTVIAGSREQGGNDPSSPVALPAKCYTQIANILSQHKGGELLSLIPVSRSSDTVEGSSEDEEQEQGNGLTISYEDMCQAIFEALEVIGEKYLDIFQYAVEKYTAFFSDLTDFISKLSTYISVSEDGSKTSLRGGFYTDLRALIDKFPVPGAATRLYPPVADGASALAKGGSKEECEQWARSLGLDPSKSMVKLKDGTWIVHIDVTPLSKIADAARPGFSGSFNSAGWAAFQSALDMQKEQVQNSVQVLAQKYSNANSTYDNVVKVLSNLINTLYESLKGFTNY